MADTTVVFRVKDFFLRFLAFLGTQTKRVADGQFYIHVETSSV